MAAAVRSDPERWRRLETLFYQASDMAARDRVAFLDKACADDASMRKEVEMLLPSDERTIVALEAPAIAAVHEFAAALVPKPIGSGQVIEEIGDGGMGQIYLARRADEAYEQRVAIKIMRADLAKIRACFSSAYLPGRQRTHRVAGNYPEVIKNFAKFDSCLGSVVSSEIGYAMYIDRIQRWRACIAGAYC